MIPRIEKHEFLPHAPNAVDEQVRVDHEDCPAGSDTRRRLYIKRLKDGTVLAYCHNCGEYGFSRSKVRNIYSYIKSKLVSPTSSKDTRLPTDVEVDINRWPVEARNWIFKYGITEREIKIYGICYSPGYDRLVFPLYINGTYVGWQGRIVIPNKDYPKYHTVVDKHRPAGNFALYKSETATLSSDPSIAFGCALVEDCVSAIKVSRQVDSIACLGTHPTDETINWVSKNYKYVFIWFDNDNEQVRRKQRDLWKLFQTLLSGNAELITSLKGDPKNHSNEEIRQRIK